MFITFEGIDRAGKTTQAKMLAEALGPDALLVREPGGTPESERIRELVKDPAASFSAVSETLLFGAARAELVERVVRPALALGRVVVCDRYVDSTIAYQGGARGLGIERVEELNDWITGGLWPDITFLLYLAAEMAGERPGEMDRLEEEGEELQRAVAGAYDELAARHLGRYVRIDAGRPPAEVHADVLAEVMRRSGGAPVTAVASATEHQPGARMVLEAGLRSADALSHAYLFHGPPGTGKREAARAFAAALLAEGADAEADVERRVQASVHPDLAWVEPRGAHDILVDDVRDQIVKQAAMRPFEAARRVFVIADADRMNDESQNALLKTLEEPAGFATYILTSSAPGRLLPTIPSRCRMVRFGPVPPARIAEVLEGEEVDPAVAAACARLAHGNVDGARYLAGEGAEQRREAEQAAALALGEMDDAEWVIAAAARPILERAATRGKAAEEAVKHEAEEALESEPGRGRQGAVREFEQQARRARRRAHTESLDLSLELVQLWFRDLVAVAGGAEAQVFNVDRLDALRAGAEGRGAPALIACVELCEDTRRRLERNVLEDLALEALFDSLRRTAARA